MSARDDYRAELRRELDVLGENGLRRELRLPSGLDLVSNDYLGFAEHPTLLARMRDALANLPAGAGGSRLLRGHHAAFAAIEARLAAFCGTDEALLFSSGFSANVGLLQTVISADDLVLSDELNHASLIDGVRFTRARKIVYRHQDLEQIERLLRAPRPRRTFIVTESVFSMDGDLTPLPELAGLADRYGALLIVDEAHATGLYGARGSGRVEETGVRDLVLASMHTGGKALGTGGAWVAACPELRESLIHRARSFVFSTAPLPVLCAGLDAALDLLASEGGRRDDLLRKSALLRAALRAAGVPVPDDRSPIVPVRVGDNAAASALQEGLALAGFDARAIRPPTVPPGTARLRVTVRQPLADADLQRFAAEVGRRLPATP